MSASKAAQRDDEDRSCAASPSSASADEGAVSASASSGIQASSAADRLFQHADERWPQLKYLSLALYSAWILLTMTNNGATGSVGLELAGVASAEFYLVSGIPLSLCLIGSALFPRIAKRLVDNRLFMVGMGLLASVGTGLLATGGVLLGGSAARALFLACGVFTGVGTSFVCLRIGCVYSAPPQGSVPLFTIIKAMLIANLLFFMCVCLPQTISAVVLALLPLLAACASLVGSREAGAGRDASDLVSIQALPKGFFPKLLLAVFVFSLVVGVVKGFSALLQTHDDIETQAIIAVFASFVIAGVLMLAAGLALSMRNYEVSKVYFPLMVCSCAAILLCLVSGSTMGAVQNIVINVGYNLFIVAVWALLSDLAERTTLSAVRVFGFGRGASGLGTTLGWLVAYSVMGAGIEPSSIFVPFFLGAVVVVFALLLLVLGQQTVSEALERMFEGLAAPVAPNGKGKADSDPIDAWERECARLADECQLTARETEVLKLLSRGRTGGYIALELGISQNTVKGHTRNVYAKLGVHSRQELIDRLELAMRR